MRKQKKINSNGNAAAAERHQRIKELEDKCAVDFDDIIRKIKEITDRLGTES